eukprot:GFUD01110250.1.p1 GENE.GFUD01110250.1~~GFUD01110250.1.p1  ORF type:complete len:150 (-),score=60.28 GFUD01110250.1:59-508(-)
MFGIGGSGSLFVGGDDESKASFFVPGPDGGGRGGTSFFGSGVQPALHSQNMGRSDQSSVLEEEVKVNLDAKTTDDDSEDIIADILPYELINMQKDQLSELMPELREREEQAEEMVDSAGLVPKDITNYSEKLSVIKQQYCSRLCQSPAS